MTIDITIGHHASPPWPVVWAPVFSAFGVFVVGCIAASIAYQQWRTAHIKLQSDLFDRRLAVFDAVNSYARAALEVLHHRHQDVPDRDAYIAAIRGCQFLFSSKVHLGAVELTFHVQHLAPMLKREAETGEEQYELRQHLQSELAGEWLLLDDLMKDYLQIDLAQRRQQKIERWWRFATSEKIPTPAARRGGRRRPNGADPKSTSQSI